MTTKVLHVYRTYYPDPPGGVQEAIRQFSLSTSKEGVLNSVFTLSANPQPKTVYIDGVEVIRKRSWASPASCDIGGASSFAEFVAQAKRHDILQYHFPWPFADCLNLVAPKNKPKILVYHSDIVKQKVLGKLYAPLMWHTLRDMDVIVATSPKYVETSPILSHPKVINKVRIIPLGINEESYPIEGDETIFAKANIDQAEPYFLFLGVHRYYKGIHTLIEAARLTSAKIVIAGDGPFSGHLRSMVETYNLRNVIFTGQVTSAEKVALFKGCRAFVLPSHLRSEAFGVVLIEAAMLGKPMITCEIGTGTSYVNQHSKTGYVVAPESPGELSEAINVLQKDDLLAHEMGAAARDRYDQYFSGNILGRAYANLYRELS
jgi:rhamnosyl/mannosyltransferase